MSSKSVLGIVAVGIATLIFSSCASSKTDVKKVLLDNPDIIFEVLEKNPSKLVEVLEKVQVEARKMAQDKAEKEMKAQMDEEFKNPKKVEFPDNRVRGNKAATIEIVEYSDFQCPYCQRGFMTVEEVRKKYGDKVKFIFKHLPLDFHPLAMPAAKRFEAIAIQSLDKAYKFHDEVFKNQQKLTAEGEKFLDDAAKKAGADIAAMKKKMESEEVKAIIAKDGEEAKKLGISGTPGFLVAGVTVRGAYPMSYFEQIIDRRLKEKN